MGILPTTGRIKRVLMKNICVHNVQCLYSCFKQVISNSSKGLNFVQLRVYWVIYNVNIKMCLTRNFVSWVELLKSVYVLKPGCTCTHLQTYIPLSCTRPLSCWSKTDIKYRMFFPAWPTIIGYVQAPTQRTARRSASVALYAASSTVGDGS
jgi:hypothetical protein